jgi:hypothetical protein
MCKGFLQIPKDFFESGYWRQSRTYNDCEAILDIINQVRFEASEHFARIGGREVTWGQHEWPASVRFLSQRWKWTERKVRTFLSSLKKHGVIEIDDTQGVSIIKLKKYVTPTDSSSDTTNDTAIDTSNALNINALIEQVTQQVTQRMTQEERKRHTTDTKHTNGYKEIDSSLRSESSAYNNAALIKGDVEYPFESFWEAYGYKKERKSAEKAWKRLCLTDRKDAIEKIETYKRDCERCGRNMKYPATYLNSRTWEDEFNFTDYGNNRRNSNDGATQRANGVFDIIQRLAAEDDARREAAVT